MIIMIVYLVARARPCISACCMSRGYDPQCGHSHLCITGYARLSAGILRHESESINDSTLDQCPILGLKCVATRYGTE